jgi:hypothetical protein
MIPGKIVRFLDQYANIAFAGTRDRNLVPYGHGVLAWRVGTDGRTLTALIAEPYTDHLLESLEDNGQLALTVEEFPSHETYQFKGRYVRNRPIEADDLAALERIYGRFVRSMRSLHAEISEYLATYPPKPALAVEFEVGEIYVQTPGPGAGARLVPPAEG